MSIDLDALIAEAVALVEDAEPELVPVVLGRSRVGVRFVPMMGSAWRDLVLKHPPRTDVMQDVNLGYNVDAVVAAYPNVALVDGDDVDDMIREDAEGKPFSKWPTVWGALTSTGRKEVATEIWAAHELLPEKVVEAAGKASAGLRKKKRS
ncbi:hypothetical protein [Microbacterium sp. LWH12-1.2]|uniref:hypothetical protein n=1 Tax=Microbacterium sp. LWH12-1.2 TaxID=3135259 RepID=UPI003440CB56